MDVQVEVFNYCFGNRGQSWAFDRRKRSPNTCTIAARNRTEITGNGAKSNGAGTRCSKAGIIREARIVTKAGV